MRRNVTLIQGLFMTLGFCIGVVLLMVLRKAFMPLLRGIPTIPRVAIGAFVGAVVCPTASLSGYLIRRRFEKRRPRDENNQRNS